MTDIVERLRSANSRMGTRDPNHYDMTITVAEANQAADEIERLRSGLMKSVQYDNKCDQTGRSCREDGPCGCQKEAETWLE